MFSYCPRVHSIRFKRYGISLVLRKGHNVSTPFMGSLGRQVSVVPPIFFETRGLDEGNGDAIDWLPRCGDAIYKFSPLTDWVISIYITSLIMANY